MLNIRTILAPTDLSACAERAFARAVELTTRYDATLHLLNVVVEHITDLDASADQADPKRPGATPVAELGLGKPAALPGSLEIVQAQVIDRAADEGILAYAEEHDVDLIVMGTRGRAGITRFLVGSIAERVIRRASCPVFLVRCQEKAPVAPGAIAAILVPIDFSAHAREALRYAKELAASYDGARVDLLHVIEEPNYPDFYNVEQPSISDILRDLERKALQHLRHLYYDVEGPNGPVRFMVVLGHAAHEILTYANHHESDLIVMATHGRTSLKEFFLGSVAEKVVRRVPCPIFMGRAFGKSLIG